MTLVVVRHARAGKSSEWEGDDRVRPLDKRGRRQAGELPGLLRDLEIRRIVSSPYLRCVQTVEPLAVARGLEVEHAPALGADRQAHEAEPLLRELLGADAVVCVHGGIEDVLDVDRGLKKGEAWLFEGAFGAPQPLG